MTKTRHNSVLVALNQILPAAYTWEERCDAHFRASFPCGIAPMFRRTQLLTVCPDQIVQAGAVFDDEEFEYFLGSLIGFMFASMAALILDETTAQVLRLFDDLHPEDAPRLKEAAAANDMPLAMFLGLDRRP